MGKLHYFSKEIDPSCSYCEYGTPARDQKRILCNKRGIVSPYSSCPKFSYAPLKRIPKRPRKPFSDFDPSDFTL